MENQNNTIIMTESAAQQFIKILEEENKVGWGLRFGIESCGCCGHEYFLDYSEHAEPTDDVFVSNGVQIHVNRETTPLLLGSIIDFVEGEDRTGFKITNPTKVCKCHNNPNGCCS